MHVKGSRLIAIQGPKVSSGNLETPNQAWQAVREQWNTPMALYSSLHYQVHLETRRLSLSGSSAMEDGHQSSSALSVPRVKYLAGSAAPQRRENSLCLCFRRRDLGSWNVARWQRPAAGRAMTKYSPGYSALLKVTVHPFAANVSR